MTEAEADTLFESRGEDEALRGLVVDVLAWHLLVEARAEFVQRVVEAKRK